MSSLMFVSLFLYNGTKTANNEMLVVHSEFLKVIKTNISHFYILFNSSQIPFLNISEYLSLFPNRCEIESYEYNDLIVKYLLRRKTFFYK